jgi:hypothetical protein
MPLGGVPALANFVTYMHEMALLLKIVETVRAEAVAALTPCSMVCAKTIIRANDVLGR